MAERRTLTRAETFEHITRIATAALAGEPMQRSNPAAAGDCMRPEDVADAMTAFARRVAERLDRIPARVSDDIKVQEVIRDEFDKAMSSATLIIHQTYGSPKS